jgi:signal peptide peptidase SppA
LSGAKRRYTQIAKAVYERPWAIQPAMLAVIEEIVRLRVAGTPLTDEEIDHRVAAASNGPRQGAARAQGVAVIPMYGVLSQRMDLMSDMSGGTSVEGLTRSFREALADPDIGAIVFDVDSPGGQVEGITELANEIRASRGAKPIVMVADAAMNSAAYWLGSQADEIVAIPSAQVGSIGVFGEHREQSGADEQAGETYTVISAGEGKATTNPHLPLTDEGRAELQAMADDFYALFVADVAAGRGVKASVITDEWKAQVFTAKRAKAAGLVDRIDTLDATVRRMVGKVNRASGGLGASGGSAIGAAWAAGIDFAASAIGHHKTATSDEAWDGPANEARCPAERGPLRASHAWVDDDADPDAKASYKFNHHFISEDGRVGAASISACANGRAVLKGGRGGTTIPAADKPGVWNHLAGHERDAGRDVGPYEGHAAETVTAAMATVPIHEQLAIVNAEGERIAAHYAKRAELRAKEGRSLSAATEAHLAALEALRTIPSDVDPDLDTDQPEETDPSQVERDWRGRARLDVLEAATRGGYALPPIEVPPS